MSKDAWFFKRHRAFEMSWGRGMRLLAAVALLSLLGACGGDEETTGGGDQQVDVAEFCEGYVEGEQAFTEGPELDEEGQPTEQGLEQFRNTVEPFVTQVEENTPEDIESEVGTVLDGVRSTLDSGDPAATQTPEFVEAETAVDEYVYDKCEFEAKQEFVAVNYAYQEVPQSLSEGRTAFRMDNEGTEVHEAVIFRINDDSNRPIQELLQAPDEQMEQNLEFRGVAIADPDTSGYVVADLDAGRYALVCFIPVGTMSFEQLTQEGEEEGASPSPGASPGTTASPGGSPSPTSASPTPTRAAATPTPSATATGSPAPGGPQGEEAPPHFTRGMVTELTVS